jgi:hypothetical protein
VRQLCSSAARGATASDRELRGLHAAISHSHSWLAALQRELALLGFYPTGPATARGDAAGMSQPRAGGGRGAGLISARIAPAGLAPRASKAAGHGVATGTDAYFGEPDAHFGEPDAHFGELDAYFGEPDADAEDPDLARLVCGGDGEVGRCNGGPDAHGGACFGACCCQLGGGCAAEGEEGGELFGEEEVDLDEDLDEEVGSEAGLWVDDKLGEEEEGDEDDLGWVGCVTGLDGTRG